MHGPPRLLVPVLALVLACTAACLNRTAARKACAGDAGCGAGERCVEGACAVDDGGCESDLDCNVVAGEVCRAGGCEAPPTTGVCTTTAECPIDQFCNGATSVCQPLLSGWCRTAAHCGASAPVCSSSDESVPGQCLQCTTAAHCGGGACGEDGTCEPSSSTDSDAAPPDGGEAGGCPPNASPVPEDPTLCACDDGFVPDATATSCVPQDEPADTGPGDGVCPVNSSPVPGLPDTCACDDGYVADAAGTACVEDTSTADDPAQTAPDDDAAPPEDDAACPPNSTELFGACFCDAGYDVNETQDGCVDACAAYGWYDDGVCDEFCPEPDPEC